MLLSQQPGSRITAEYTKVSGSSHILIQLESKLGSRGLFCNKSIQHLGNYIWPILPPKKTKISDCFAICYTLYMSYSYHCLTYHLDTLGIFFCQGSYVAHLEFVYKEVRDHLAWAQACR